MEHLVALLPAPDGGVASNYDVRVGPLAFVTPASLIAETAGDGLDVVGASLTASERRPRPLKLKLPVRGDEAEIDQREAGLRLRRQVRQALDNARLRLQGFYFTWAADPDLDGWLMIGGGELSENDPGITFGDFALELTDVYKVGREGTHRPARRAAISDRRSGMVPRDTRRLLYSVDFASQALPAQPIILPGDVADLVSTGNRPVASSTIGPERAEGRHLWRTAAGIDGEVISYRPDSTVLPNENRKRYLDLDELGSVRVWDLSAATPYPPNPLAYSTPRDSEPDVYMGWERVYGDLLTADTPLAMDNGACRLIWLGPLASQGLAIEAWDSTVGHYRRMGRVLHALNVAEQRVVEYTPERAVLEWRAGRYGMRAILQRGWYGPRLESYDDGGETTRLEYAPEGAALDVSAPNEAIPWVRLVGGLGINGVINPSLEYGTTGWSTATSPSGAQKNGATISATASQHFVGAKALQVVTSGVRANEGAHVPIAGSFIKGQKYAISVYLKGAAGGEKVTINLEGEESDEEELATTLTTSWVRYSFIWTATRDTTELLLSLAHGPISAITFYADAAMVGPAPLSAYVDGDTPGYIWDGTPGQSATVIARSLMWASGTNDEAVTEAPTLISGPAVTFSRTRVLVAQLAATGTLTPAQLASLSLIDARPVPDLVGRE